MIIAAVGLAGALALATLLGVSDAPKAAAALLASRTGSYRAVAVSGGGSLAAAGGT